MRKNNELGTLTSFREGREILFYKLVDSGFHITGSKQSAFNKYGK